MDPFVPAPVDHDSKRREVARIAAGLIADEGLDGATIRRVAAAAGFSTTVITHYFATKRQLLLAAYRYLAEIAQARFDAAAAERPLDLVNCLETLLPLDEESRRAWRVYFEFWPMANRDDDFAREQQWWNRNAVNFAASLVRGKCLDSEDADRKAQLVLSALQGIALQSMFDPEQWPPTKQRAMLRSHVSLILNNPGDVLESGTY